MLCQRLPRRLALNLHPADEHRPAFSLDGRWLAFVFNRKGGVGLSDIWLFTRLEKKVLAVPQINSPGADLPPALNEDGSLLALTSDRLGGAWGRDIYLYDCQAQKLLPTPGLNSKKEDFDPCVLVLK